MRYTSLKSCRLLLNIIIICLVCGTSTLQAQMTDQWTISRDPSSSIYGGFDRFGSIDQLTSCDGMSIYFRDLSIGSNTILSSTDGGANWFSIVRDKSWSAAYSKEAYTYQVIHSASPKCLTIGGHITEYVNKAGGGDVTRKGFLASTTDRGATWNTLEFDTNTRISSVAMCDSLTGYAFLTMTGNDSNRELFFRPGVLCRTDDGWKTYIKIALPDTLLWADPVKVFGKNEIVMNCYNYALKTMRVYATSDGGKSWSNWKSKFFAPFFSGLYESYGSNTELLANSYTLPGIHTVQYAKDTSSSIQTLLKEQSTSMERLGQVVFADKLHGIAYGSGQCFFVTSDGGATWSRQQVPVPQCYNGRLIEAVYPNADNAVMLANDNSIIVYHGKKTLASPQIISPDVYDRRYLKPQEIHFEWTPIAGATHYQLQVVERSIKNQNNWDYWYFDFPYLDTTLESTSLTLLDRSYFYHYDIRVRAMNERDTSSWNRLNCFQVYTTLLIEGQQMPPRIVSPPNGQYDVPINTTYKWDAVPGALSYSLQIAASPDQSLTGPFIVDVSGLTEPRYQVLLKSDTSYYAHVRAQLTDSTTQWSDYYNMHLIKTGTRTVDVGESPSVNATVEAYPQPARTVLHVNCTDKLNGTTAVHASRILNTLGQEVVAWTQSERLDVRSLGAGAYILETNIQGNTLRRSIIVAD